MSSMANDESQNATPKVFLRRKGGLYYGPDGDWTPNRDKAKDFEDAGGALMFGRASDVQGLEIVMLTNDGESSLTING